MELDDEQAVTPDASCPAFPVAGFTDAWAALRSKDVLLSAVICAGAHRDPGVEAQTCLREFIGSVVEFSNGESHRARRKLLNQLVRPAALDRIRDEVVVPRATELLPRLVTGPHADGKYRIDLVPFCERVFLHFAAKFIGLVGTDTDEQMERLRECVEPLGAAIVSAFYKDRAGINAAAREAKARYVEEFYLPSRGAARARLAQRSESDPALVSAPENFLDLVVSGVNADWNVEALAIRDSMLLFAASVGSSTQAVVNSVAGLTEWYTTHPEDYPCRTDYDFLLGAMQEAVRLTSPSSPYMQRIAQHDTTIGGQPVAAGREIKIYLPTANRDPSVWGPDGGTFNPRRQAPEGWQRHGIAFSAGTHQCLGQRVVMGSDGTGGAHVRVLQTLYAAGARTDPDNPPKTIERVAGEQVDPYEVEVPRWTSYPVVLDEFDPTTWRTAQQAQGLAGGVAP